MKKEKKVSRDPCRKSELKFKIEHYDQAYMEIMTVAQDDVDFRIFSVVCKKLKK